MQGLKYTDFKNENYAKPVKLLKIIAKRDLDTLL